MNRNELRKLKDKCEEATVVDAHKVIHDTFKALGVPELCDNTVIKFNSRLSSTAGKATWRKCGDINMIELSSKIWGHVNITDTFRIETAVHEACHIADDFIQIVRHKLWHPKSHGGTWKNLMHLSGYSNARACHQLDTYAMGLSKRRAKQPKYRFECGCPDGLILGQTRTRRIFAGHTHYTCRRCNQKTGKFLGKVE